MTTLAPPVPRTLISLQLPSGIPGFPHLHELTVEPWGGPTSPFVVLSAEEPAVRFVAAPPAVFFPDYAPPLPEPVLAALGLEAEEAALLVLLTVGATVADTTANLLGPLVVNPCSGQAAQVVLSGTSFSPRTSIAG